MTVLELVRTYGLEDFSKHYKNVLGISRDTAFIITELKDMKVKSVSIDFLAREANITLDTFQ